jgi:bis(5'-nucleosidyl)-tetraphosphatase
MPTDRAYGVIPVHRSEDGELSVLLVAKRDPTTGEKWWGFPKGHAEAGEGPRAAALRELKEEAGLIPDVLGDTEYNDRYVVLNDGIHKDKTITYIVGRVSDTDVVIDRTEIDEYRWAPPDLVDHILTRDSTKAMYCLAQHEVETLGNAGSVSS